VNCLGTCSWGIGILHPAGVESVDNKHFQYSVCGGNY